MSNAFVKKVNYGGVASKNSPFRVNVKEPLNVDLIRIYGPGVEKEVKSGIPTHFTVDSKEAGTGMYKLLHIFFNRHDSSYCL